MPTSAALDVVAKKLKLKFFEVRPILFYVFLVIYNCKDEVYHLDSRVNVVCGSLQIYLSFFW